MNASAGASMRLATRIGSARLDDAPDIGPVDVLPLDRDGRVSGGQESPASGPEVHAESDTASSAQR